jgi:hypothetical protein
MEPFAKIVEWLDLQENIEEDSFFSILRLKPVADRPPFRHPRESGNDEQESVFGLECAKLIKSHAQILSKNRFLYSFGDFGYPRNRA